MQQEMMPGFERNELQDIIIYFAYQINHLTEIRLNKLIYVGELYHIEKFGKRMTDVPFIHYFHGPYSARICAEGEKISGTEIDVKDEKVPYGYDATFYMPIEGKEMEISLSGEKISILNDVLGDWKFKSTDDLINFTKSTYPFRRSRFGEVLDLDKYAGTMKLVYSKEAIESVKNSQNDYKEGKGRTFINKTDAQKYYDAL